MAPALIIGASHAAAQLIVSLRQGGYRGPITLLGEEPSLPYHRPPLSKDFLAGKATSDDLLIRPPMMYQDYGITTLPGTRAEAIDPVKKTVSTDLGENLDYDKLVLATGARARKLPIPGTALEGVFYLRSIADVAGIKYAIPRARRAVIIGGGYIGLEAAASLTRLGIEVTVLEAMERILQRVTAPELSGFYKRVHREEGVAIRERTAASAIEKTRDGLVVICSDDSAYPADLVIIGIGIIPNVELAHAAGIDVTSNTGHLISANARGAGIAARAGIAAETTPANAAGIRVNEFGETSAPDIYAAGDVTWHYNPIYDRYLRLESVPNATEQAKIIARHITGKPTPYNSLPWFWSDQFDLKLQIAGLFDGYDEIVIRGPSATGRKFAAFYFAGDRLLAVDAVNSPKEFMFAKMMIPKGVTLDRSRLGDPDQALKSCIID